MKPLPILLYHSIDDDPPDWIAPFSVGARAFRDQLDRVVASGRTPVRAAQVLDALAGGPELPERSVLITFDDGFEDFVRTALPALSERALPPALFVTTGCLRPARDSLLPPARMLSAAQVAQIAEAGVELGAHTHTHPQLDAVPRGAAREELTVSKDILEQTLERPVDLLAYPHGYSDPAVRTLAAKIGYRGGFAVRNALSSEHDDMFRVARLTVRADTPREQFDAWLRGEGARTAPYRESIATRGWRIYRRGRNVTRARAWAGVRT